MGRIDVGFTGTSRGMTQLQYDRVLDELSGVCGDERWFHHGDCVGADAEAHAIAKSLGFKVCVHPPLDGKLRAYCVGYDEVQETLPYLVRNRAIVDHSTRLLAVPDTVNEVRRSGTWATVRYARKQDVPTTMIWPYESKENDV